MTHLSAGAIFIAILGGLASFFSPCVAPLAPGYISYISSLTLSDSEVSLRDAGGFAAWRSKIFGSAALASVLFVAGFSIAFIALGFLVAGFGTLLAAYRPVMETVAGIVMLAMGAFLLGLLPRQVTEFLMRESRVQLSGASLRGWGLAAPVALGVVFAAGWTPCIGPVLTSILVFVGATGPAGQGALLLAFYSLGFAIPFLAIGIGWSFGLRAFGWSKRYNAVIAKVSGVALILVALLYLTGEVSVISAWAQRFAIGFAPGPALTAFLG
ncbi:MAG TPA: cytochrome c biogenesis protein CcdA [Ktedonobacterales bacterium]